MSKKSTLFDSGAIAAQAPGTTNYTQFDASNCDEILIGCNVTVLAAGTVDLKLQWSPDKGTTWIDYTGSAFTQMVAVGSQSKAIGPPVPRYCRLVLVIGGSALTGQIWVESSRNAQQ